MQAISISALSALSGVLFAGLQAQTIFSEDSCARPVQEYTTGELGETTEQLYSDSVEWVVESYHALPSRSGFEGQHDGWVVLIHLIADGDDGFEDFELRDDDLAQVKWNGEWMLQHDFEVMLCSQNS